MLDATESLPEDYRSLKALLLSERKNHKTALTEVQDQLSAALEAIRLGNHRHFGASSEKAPNQSELFDEAEDCIASFFEEENESKPATSKSSTKSKPARKPLPKDLSRVRQVHELSVQDCQCGCGAILTEIGEDISEQVDIIPAKVQVIQHVRKKYACRTCDNVIKLAPRPQLLLPKAIASANTMAYIIASKYADGLPLYRLSGILKRHGIELPRQTLSESVLKVASLLDPLMAHMQQKILQSPVLHMDETRVQVLKEPGKSSQSQSYMWVQRGGPPDKPIVLFNYDPSRAASVPAKLLAGYKGALMTDGYEAYRSLAKSEPWTHLCCWSHARRKFIEAQKSQPKGKVGKADMAVNFIAKLYTIEKQQRENDIAQRNIIRQERSLLVLNQFHCWLLKTQQQVPPRSGIGKAVAYTLNFWPELSRYVENGSWPIDNNVAENAIRPFVIGRKAWLFSDSQRGAKASANLYGLIETAKANGREPYAYLSWLFAKLPGFDNDNLEELLPWNMVTKS